MQLFNGTLYEETEQTDSNRDTREMNAHWGVDDSLERANIGWGALGYEWWPLRKKSKKKQFCITSSDFTKAQNNFSNNNNKPLIVAISYARTIA